MCVLNNKYGGNTSRQYYHMWGVRISHGRLVLILSGTNIHPSHANCICVCVCVYVCVVGGGAQVVNYYRIYREHTEILSGGNHLHTSFLLQMLSLVY